jgi:DNA-binding transcriptional regulator YiaG
MWIHLPDAIHKGRHKAPDAKRGSENKNAKLTEDNVKDIRKSSKSTYKLAKTYGVAPRTIQRIVSGNGWKHVI